MTHESPADFMWCNAAVVNSFGISRLRNVEQVSKTHSSKNKLLAECIVNARFMRWE